MGRLASKQRMKSAAVAACRSREEAETALLAIGALQREIGDIERDINDRIASVRLMHQDRAEALNASIEGQFNALHAWAEVHRAELCPGRLKTVTMMQGTLSWRVTPPSVRVTKPEVVIETLKRLGLLDLIRAKEEINKDAILSEPERVRGVRGIRVSQHEEFVAKPAETQIERAATVARVESQAAA